MLRSKSGSHSPPLSKGGRGGSLTNWSDAPDFDCATVKILPRCSLAALCVVLSIAAGPALAADSAVVLGEPEPLGAVSAVSAPHAASKPARKRPRKAPQTSGRTERAVIDLTKPQSAGTSRSGRIARTDYVPDTERTLKPMPDVESPRDTGGIAMRPFRKINDIVPYDNYEPDPELAKQDGCYNLCPRPKGGDCPDCNATDSDGNPIAGVHCPECPWEQDLRRIGRKAGEPDIAFVPRDFAHIHYCWEPTNLYHNPIYFEDVPLERYGHTRHYILIQPFFSVSKFALQLVGLPYQLSLNPIWDRQYSLGYYRPGEYVPYKYYQIPLNAKAAVVEAGVISGSYFIFAPGVGP